jgi:uncharacterized protein (DUF488 family)
MHKRLLTIGHSTHPLEQFLALLKMHGVTALCDVRSAPYSRVNPQFNREEFSKRLRLEGIAYVFLGRELGGRSDDPSCYDAGKVQYDRLAKKTSFCLGLDRLQEGANKYLVCLMCAEKDPLECHRAILVARQLDAPGFVIEHIHADGRLESHADALERLIVQLNLPVNDIFRSHQDVIANAYRLQEDRIAYARNDSRVPKVFSTRKATA